VTFGERSDEQKDGWMADGTDEQSYFLSGLRLMALSSASLQVRTGSGQTDENRTDDGTNAKDLTCIIGGVSTNASSKYCSCLWKLTKILRLHCVWPRHNPK
jgi:hypothetical protein